MIFALFPQAPTAAQQTDASSTPDVTAAANVTTTATPAAETNPLLAMLALVPESALNFGDPPHTIRYADFAALEATHNIQPDSAAEFAALNDTDRNRWTNALQRLQALPPYILNNSYQRIQEMPTLVGFEWFDIDQVLTFDNLPFAGMIYAGDFDPASIETALTEREFGVTEYEGVTIWNRGGDGMTDITLMSLGDPFGGDVGWSSRIAVMPSQDGAGGADYLANGVFWEVAGDIVLAHTDQKQSLAEMDAYRVMAEAITDNRVYEGSLLQAIFVNAEDAAPGVRDAESTPEATAESTPEITQSDTGELPPYRLVALADRQENGQQVHMVALLYSNPGLAQQAAAELSARLGEFEIEGGPAGVRIDEPHVYVSHDTGLAVAIASVSYPLPLDPITPPAAVFAAWMRAIDQKAFWPLAL